MKTEPGTDRPKAWAAVEWLTFFGLAVWSTYPAVLSWKVALPIGTEPAATVPLFNLWTIWWNADRAGHAFSGYWDAPIFHPTRGTFAFSEPQPLTALLAPLVWWSETPVPACNAYLLLALTLNGWFAARLVRHLTGDRVAALCGGAMVVMLPFVHWQLGVYQLVPLWGAICSLEALLRFGERPSVRGGLSLGAALACTYWLCANHGLFLVLLLIASGAWLLGRNLWSWSAWLKLVPGTLLCLALVGPIIQMQRRIAREFDFERTAELMTTLSAEPGDFSVTNWPQLLPLRHFADPQRMNGWQMSPGNIKWLLAAAGIIVGLVDRRLRLWTLFAITFALAAFFLSQGLKLKIGGWQPYQFLIDRFPGVAQVRNVFRFALFLQLIVALLAAQGLELFSPARWAAWRTWWRTRRGGEMLSSAEGATRKLEGTSEPLYFRKTGALLTAAMVVVGGLAAGEVRPPRQRLFEMPALVQNRGWIEWLRNNTDPADPIACVPFPQGVNVEAYFGTAEWMYWQTFHGRRMVNGYSGFFPDEEFLQLKTLMEEFPTREGLTKFWVLGVKYCVVSQGAVSAAALERDPELIHWLKPVFSDEAAGVNIYRLSRLEEAVAQ